MSDFSVRRSHLLFRPAFLILGLVALAIDASPARSGPIKARSEKQPPVVRVNVTNQPYDFFRPWSKKAPSSRRALGAVLSHNRILVTAELVANANYVELERAESGRRVAATILRVDYEANLALLKPQDDNFLEGVQALELVSSKVGDRVALWQLESSGALLITDALVTTVEVSRYPIDDVGLLIYRLTSSLQYREGSFTVPVIHKGALTGLLMRYDARTQNVDAVPAPVIEHFLQEADKPEYFGFPRTGMQFSPLRDPQLRRHVGIDKVDVLPAEFAAAGGEKEEVPLAEVQLTAAPKGGQKYALTRSGNAGGVYVTLVQTGSPAAEAGIVPGDVILAINDHSIDQDGNYDDEEYGTISLIHLVTTKTHHGDTVRLKILRNDLEQEVNLAMRHRPFTDYVIEPYTIDRGPKFYILGGLVLQELSRQYLKEWGNDWLKKAPERFTYYDRYQTELFKDSTRKIVVLSQVLPSPSTVGYESLDYIVVTRINGLELKNLSDVATAVNRPIDGFHKIELEETPGEIYLDATQVAADNPQLMKNYGLPDIKRLD